MRLRVSLRINEQHVFHQVGESYNLVWLMGTADVDGESAWGFEQGWVMNREHVDVVESVSLVLEPAAML